MAKELQRTTKTAQSEDHRAVLGSSPSFSSYTSSRLAEIAAVVGGEDFGLLERSVSMNVDRRSNGDDYIGDRDQEEKKKDEREKKKNDDDDEKFVSSTANGVTRKDEAEAETESDATTTTEDDDDFEFSCVCSHHEALTISADEIFANGQIRPIYPIFDRDRVSVDDQFANRDRDSKPNNNNKKAYSSGSRNPLRKLFNEERYSTSWSSSDFDDLESIPPETYCVWVPKSDRHQSPPSSVDRCKKSSSTGTSSSTSARWKLRDLIRRSNSDGKDSTMVFLARSTSCPKTKKKTTPEDHEEEAVRRVKISPTKEAEKRCNGNVNGNGNAKIVGKLNGKGVSGNSNNKKAVSAHESLYVRNRTSKEIARRQSYLPYRRDIVGFFANVNGLGFKV